MYFFVGCCSVVWGVSGLGKIMLLWLLNWFIDLMFGKVWFDGVLFIDLDVFVLCWWVGLVV